MTILSSVITALSFLFMPAQTTISDIRLEPIVNLPAGYFLLKTQDDAPDGYISVAYDDIKGFVKADDVAAVDYTPVTKYETTVRFRCNNDGQPVNLRAAPQKNAAVLRVLGSAASGRCYGNIRGEALIAGGDTLWYYVKIDDCYGYCYYAHVDVDATPPNIIEKEPSVQPTDTPPQEEDDEPLPKTAAIIMIVALCIPVPIILFYLFRKPRDGEN